MAEGPSESGKEVHAAMRDTSDGANASTSTPAATAATDPSSDDDDEDEEGEEEEPKLKYTRLTGSLSTVYRNGDATSAFIVAGDKMVIGTHNGNVVRGTEKLAGWARSLQTQHVLSSLSLETLRLYHAHSASVTAVSVSPYPPPWTGAKGEAAGRLTARSPSTPTKAAASASAAAASPRTPKQLPVPATPSNSIYVATCSVDGHVCVSSLIDPKEVTLRNFARPLQAVALSPEYKTDRNYLSGGLAGNLILTNGGRVGVSSNANTTSAAAAATGWLGSIGLTSNAGRDTVLHSGEGGISVIKWSLSGKLVMWANEHGIKIMRSNLHLDGTDADLAWKRIAHVAKPPRRIWDEMAGVWKARAEWLNEGCLEPDERDRLSFVNGLGSSTGIDEDTPGAERNGKDTVKSKKDRLERLLVGWGDTAWIIHVQPEKSGAGRGNANRSIGSADIVHILRFDDCIISGTSLFTPSLLLILAYRTQHDNDKSSAGTATSTPRRGIQHRQNGLQPELRLIDVETKAEIDVDTLSFNRFESLSTADYHMSTVFIPPTSREATLQRGALETISGGLWEASRSAGRMFSSGASTASQTDSGHNVKTTPSHGSGTDTTPMSNNRRSQEAIPTMLTVGLKVFVQSPYDCVLAVKRDLSDHLTWLLDHERYEQAWLLIEQKPEVVAALPERQPTSTPSTPAKGQQSLAEFFESDDDPHGSQAPNRGVDSAVEKEKRRIGDMWVQQLVAAGDWASAGKVAGEVLGVSPRWEHWLWTFAHANRFDEITPYIPTTKLHPPLPSLIYEVILGHYIMHDRTRLKELLERWDPHMFDISSVAAAIEEKLKANYVNEVATESGEQGKDWRILLEMLAKLYIADGRPREALKCYVRLQNADAAMAIIRHFHLLSALADDISGFVTIRISKDQLESLSLHELEDASTEAVHVLVDEALHGNVSPEEVIRQLERKGHLFRPFLFFYMKALWKGRGSDDSLGRRNDRMTTEGKVFVEDYGDLAVELFAEFDRPLLMEFLRSSQSYSYERASTICEAKNYVPELVHLLAKTGQTKRALFLVIDKLGDVSQAVSFAKEQNDPDLWNDLLDYSMDKPRFIRALLEEVGTAINPIALVRRIPEGLEIEGLRDGVGRMVREYEIQFSISEGVAKVLRGEVATGMDTLRAGQKKGVKFAVRRERTKRAAQEIREHDNTKADNAPRSLLEPPNSTKHKQTALPGHCVGCGKAYLGEDDGLEDAGILVGFACGHVHHLSCIISAIRETDGGSDTDASAAATAAAERLQAQLAQARVGGESRYTGGSVGAKVAHAHVIRAIVRAGCSLCGRSLRDAD